MACIRKSISHPNIPIVLEGSSIATVLNGAFPMQTGELVGHVMALLVTYSGEVCAPLDDPLDVRHSMTRWMYAVQKQGRRVLCQ